MGLKERVGDSTPRVRRLRDRRRRGVRCLVTVEVTDAMLESLVRRGLLTLRADDRTTRDEIAEAIDEVACR